MKSFLEIVERILNLNDVKNIEIKKVEDSK